MNQSKPTLLLIDDDVSFATTLCEFLELHGYSVRIAHDGTSGLEQLNTKLPDMIILDVMLPDINGFDVLTRLREDHDVPVIMLTARGEESDRIFGLLRGADDYLPKPFNPLELTARIQAVLKRTGQESAPVKAPESLTAGTMTLNLKRRSMDINGAPVQLTAAEMRVMEQLMRHPGEVLSRARLTQLALDRPIEAYDRSIDTLISKIRRKLEAAGLDTNCIRGLRGHGYVLDDDFGETR